MFLSRIGNIILSIMLLLSFVLYAEYNEDDALIDNALMDRLKF